MTRIKQGGRSGKEALYGIVFPIIFAVHERHDPRVLPVFKCNHPPARRRGAFTQPFQICHLAPYAYC